MKEYLSSVESEVSWIGKIPTHWKIMKIAYFVDKITNGYVGPTRDILRDEGVRYIQSLHIKKNTIDFHKPYYVSQEWSAEHERIILRENDVLVVQTGAIGEVGIVPKEFDGASCHALIILRAKENLGYGKFLLYALTSNYGYHSILSIMTGALHPHLNTTYLRDVYLAIPPKNEQQAIADFLDRKTAQIDALIEKKQRQIELLQEQRTALINQAVTKGLNPDIKMKDSGLDWLGEIPSHWKVLPYKYVTTRVVVGIAEAATHAYADSGVPIIRTTNVKPNRLVTDDMLYIEEWFADKNDSKYLYPGDIITARTGTPGTSAVIPDNINKAQCFTMLISTLKSGELPDFYSYYINSDIANIFFNLEAWGTAQRNISVPILQRLPVVEPPFDEQQQIIDYIKQETSKMDALIRKHSQIMEKIREYRTALISEAVTGKIDVR